MIRFLVKLNKKKKKISSDTNVEKRIKLRMNFSLCGKIFLWDQNSYEFDIKICVYIIGEVFFYSRTIQKKKIEENNKKFY